ncbi:hypothetical protein LEQ41_10725 [Streptococcus agalactiae]|nr:hypothetical protein [Streptococcus agalactiae]
MNKFLTSLLQNQIIQDSISIVKILTQTTHIFRFFSKLFWMRFHIIYFVILYHVMNIWTIITNIHPTHF